MERISAFTDLCTAAGLFRYGTAAGGVPPTPVKAEWLNLIQEELCNFVMAYLPKLDAGGQHSAAQGGAGVHSGLLHQARN